VENETAMVGSSSAGKVVYSHAVTLYGIPVVYIVIVVLFILFFLYLFCRVKRKDRHSMKKSSYLKLGRVPKSLTYFYISLNLLLLGGLESLLKSIFHNFFAGTKIVLIMELIIKGI